MEQIEPNVNPVPPSSNHEIHIDGNLSAQFGSPIIPASTNQTFDIGSLAKNGMFNEHQHPHFQSEGGTGLTTEMETAMQNQWMKRTEQHEEHNANSIGSYGESSYSSLTESATKNGETRPTC